MARKPEEAEAYNERRRKANVHPDEWARRITRDAISRKKNPNKYKWFRKYDLKRHYNLTLEEWNTMFEEQGFCCKVCRSPQSGRKNGQWCTDHNHVTGEVRGILCNGCNMALGQIQDDPHRLRLLAEYVEDKGETHSSN